MESEKDNLVGLICGVAILFLIIMKVAPELLRAIG